MPHDFSSQELARMKPDARMSSSMQSFLAYCPFCEQKVTASPVLADAELRLALDNDIDVEVIHLTVNAGDHRWRLIRQERENLRRLLKRLG